MSRHFWKVVVHFSVIRILRLRSASEIGIAGLVGLFLDSGLHFADDAEAPMAVARDVDAALLVTAEGRWAATRAGSLDAARVRQAPLVWLCYATRSC